METKSWSFNGPEEVSVGDPEKDEFGNVVQLDLHFKAAGEKYNFKLLHAHKPTKYNGTVDRVIVEWDNLREELIVVETTCIAVHKNAHSTSISFRRYDDIEVNIICKKISGLP